MEMFNNPSILVNIDGTILDGLSGLDDRAGWVLAGGRSSRMGEDKALIEIDGLSLARRVAAEARKICGSAALVGDPARYGALGLTGVSGSLPGQGPLAGIEAALSATKVRMEPDRRLRHARARSGTARVVVSDAGRTLRPTVCCLHTATGGLNRFAPCTTGAAMRPSRGAPMPGIGKVTDALGPLALRYLRVTRPDSFANLNTPEELVSSKRSGGNG